ncbi:MAG: hypothetical protein DHS20C18_06900 [Saprospiraceae bacterium]|nr:MAG: hypothetical protein DHS20C18_06900 [Saprospiraceae bacterium]
MCKKKLLFLIVIFFSCSLGAQDFLGDDLPFFQKKSQLFDHWLKTNGMGEVLKVDKIQLAKEETDLELFLLLNTTNPDTAAAIWTGLKAQFSKNNIGQTLEKTLYDTFVRMMEIPSKQGNIQVYFPKADGIGHSLCFYVWIWEETGKIEQESKLNACRAQLLNIPITLPEVKQVSGNATLRVATNTDAKAVFDNIIQYAKKRYEVIKCHNRSPKVQSIQQNDYSLSFVVNDLCQEVLSNEQKSLWCDFVELWWGPCNDIRRERLEFTFNFIPTQEGYFLNGSLTGKFGSGVYRPRISGYMDMEPNFEEDFLIPYVQDFQNDLRQYLEH